MVVAFAVAVPWLCRGRCSKKFQHLCSSFLQHAFKRLVRFLVFFTMYKWIAYVVRTKNTYTHIHTHSHTHTKLHSKIGQIRAIRGEYKLVRFVALGLRWWFIWCAMQFHVNCYCIIYLCAHVFCGLHIFNGNSETVCQNRIHYFGSQLGQILKAEPA